MKIYKILLMALFFVIMSSFAHAYVDATFNFNRNDVEVLAYNCNDAGCNTVSPFSGQFVGSSHTNNGQVTIRFPSTLVGHGYAIYFYSPGRIPIAGKATLHSHGDGSRYTISYDIDFTQVIDCQSVIDEFTVTNDVYRNEPLTINTSSSLDARTASAYTERNNGVGYIPPHMVSRYYSSDVRVDLEIRRGNTVVNTQQQFFDYAHGNAIRMDEQADVSFTWVPRNEGRHTATVRTVVTDTQCANSLQANSQKDFTVLPERPSNECYTLLNGLRVNNHHAIVGDELTFTFNKLSNHADGNHFLTPIPTRINYFVYEGATLVDSGTTTMSANSNNYDEEEYSFIWTPTQSGYLHIIARGVGDSLLCNGLPNHDEELRLNFNVRDIPTFELDLQAADSINGEFIEGVRINLQNIGTQLTNNRGRTIFRNLSGYTTYHFTATHQDYETHTGFVQINDVSMFHRFTMNPLRDPALQVSIQCFEDIVENNEQSCSVFVIGNNEPVGNSNVEIRYDDGRLFGSCVTNSISGGCEVSRLETQVGTYRVRARATAQGYTEGFSNWFTYEVLRERYDIVNLRVFSDSGFNNENYVFYRGEDMYVSFESTDRENNNVHVPNLVSRVTLVSTPGGRADLSLISQANGFYYYRLTPIPATHEFLGDSQAFAFVFNFTDNSGGQRTVDLTILNNPPVITGIVPTQNLHVGEFVTINLANYEYDVEDSGYNLTWSVSNVNSNIASVNIDNKILSINAINRGSFNMLLRLTDLNGDSDTQLVTVNVDYRPSATISFTNTPPSEAYVLVNYLFNLNAISSLGHTLTYHPVNVPSTFTIDETTGVISWLPMPQHLGIQTITVMATDGNDIAYLTWTVNVRSQSEIGQESQVLRNDLGVNSLRFPNTERVRSGDVLTLNINLENYGDFDLNNLRVNVNNLDLNLRRTIGPFNLRKGQSTSRVINVDIPSNTPPGEYYIRIVMSNNDITRVKHRPIIVI